MNNRVRFQSPTMCADTFEIVSYRDSITTVDITPLCYLLRLKPYKDCRLWVVNDLCGGICVIFTYSLIIFAECVACFVLFCDFWDSVHDAVNAAVFQCCTALAVVSHLVCMFTDPVCIARAHPLWSTHAVCSVILYLAMYQNSMLKLAESQFLKTRNLLIFLKRKC